MSNFPCPWGYDDCQDEPRPRHEQRTRKRKRR